MIVGEIKMKRIRNALFVVFAILLGSPLLHAQDFSKYRNFSLGMSLNEIVKLTDTTLAQVKTSHSRPGLTQELNWWPPTGTGGAYQGDAIQQILFLFYNGELYRIFVTYDPRAVEGLTTEDMVQSISARYGPAVDTIKKMGNPANAGYSQQMVASWEDSQYCVKLVRDSFSGSYGLTLLSKRANAEAETASVEARRLEELERPQKEAGRLKKEADNLEIERQKNKKVFRP
jgi:hypothetical protein